MNFIFVKYYTSQSGHLALTNLRNMSDIEKFRETTSCKTPNATHLLNFKQSSVLRAVNNYDKGIGEKQKQCTFLRIKII